MTNQTFGSLETMAEKKKEDEQFGALSVGRWSEQMYETWDSMCDKLEESDNPHVVSFSRNFLRRLSVEAPVVVGFVSMCVLLHLLNITILPGISFFFGVDDFFSFTNPLQYIRLLTHIFGHDGMAHLRGNISHLLLVGPSAEAAFGSKETLQIMVLVAVSSGIAHIFLGRNNSRQLGASGVVFALILLNSLVSAKAGKVPLSFLLTACLWIGDELWKLFFSRDATSHHAHLTGAIVGTIAGYLIHQKKEEERTRNIALKWKSAAKKK
jgi:membrane associated rhomboid family serine protease